MHLFLGSECFDKPACGRIFSLAVRQNLWVPPWRLMPKKTHAGPALLPRYGNDDEAQR